MAVTQVSQVSAEQVVTAKAVLATSSETPLPRSSIDPPIDLSALTPDTESYGTLLDTYGNEFEVPDFTIKQIRDAIPAECFERSALRGFGYVARDLTLIATMFYLANRFITAGNVPSYWLRFVLWNIYGFANGLFGTGVWVLAHECGHQAFSTSKVLNDTVGLVLHSALLVPYFSWKISHGKHHKATAHMERDMVWVPRVRSQFATKVGVAIENLCEVSEDTPIHTLLYIAGRQLLGWPVYLLTNTTGHNRHDRQGEGRGRGKRNGLWDGINHFNPKSPIFDAKDAALIALSDVGIFVTAFVLKMAVDAYGWSSILVWYFLPYIWVNNWLVAITFLQHTDPTLPHYSSSSWTFTRGAAATVDREFGFIGRQLFHGIIETHVLHHCVSTIPFYNADRATEAIKPIMGKHYRSETSEGSLGFIKNMWRNIRMCQWVEPSEGAEGVGKDILFFRNRQGLGPAPLKLKGR